LYELIKGVKKKLDLKIKNYRIYNGRDMKLERANRNVK
jgi:hypothetical protein